MPGAGETLPARPRCVPGRRRHLGPPASLADLPLSHRERGGHLQARRQGVGGGSGFWGLVYFWSQVGVCFRLIQVMFLWPKLM